MPTKLGQNFLISESTAERIAKSADLSGTNVLEIGPGKGMLTKYLAEKAKKVLAIEIDDDLAAELEKNPYKNTKIMRGDVLKIDMPKLIEQNIFKDYKIAANLPYYITSKIIRLFLETKYPPSEMLLMVQKEVGERIVALDSKESILSISVKFYAEPEILFEVSRENFDPAPEVDSVVIRIKRKENPPKADAKKLFSLVKAGFSSKRKMLANNLSNSLHEGKDKIIETIKKSGLDPEVRAEKLKVDDWVRLYGNLYNRKGKK